ncbi:hypothetical protein ALC62_07969 [Cyphomyrmex costatus]|uniref:Uncharacterized protein n=1 Tax=Cyphomyrmex costatus TaxID=456900 RepID=A0A195CKU7_9HYME|nr:hypothetical protein ALC62_07969 [Cyphomyrmex costatus]
MIMRLFDGAGCASSSLLSLRSSPGATILELFDAHSIHSGGGGDLKASGEGESGNVCRSTLKSNEKRRVYNSLKGKDVQSMLREEGICVYQIDDLHDEDIDHLPSKRCYMVSPTMHTSSPSSPHSATPFWIYSLCNISEIAWKEQRERERKGGRSALEAASCAMDIHSRWMGIERSRSHSRTIIGRRANGSKRARQAEGGSGGGYERGRGTSPCKSHHRSNTACILNVTW